MPEYKKSEAKDWARERFHGLENILVPSLKLEEFDGGSSLNMDEEGIRHDVRECRRHKFFMCTAGIEGVPFMMLEMIMREFWEIAVDEAGGDIFIDAYVSANTFDDTVAAARLAQDCGCDSIMLAYPPFWRPETEDEIFEFTRAVCDSIDIAVVAYPSHKYNFERFHTSSFSPGLLRRIVGIENVVAAKLGVAEDITYDMHCFDLCGDKALLASPSPRNWSILVKHYGQQWAGSAPYEFLQDREHTYAADYFTLLTEGKYEQAMDLYWRIFPKAEIMQELLDYTVYEGVYNMMHFKYIGWLAGFNGGPITLPTARLYEHQKKAMREARENMGLENREPDEEFYIGRVRYADQGGARGFSEQRKTASPAQASAPKQKSGTPAALFGSVEWLDSFVANLQEDPKYKEFSKNYEGGPLILTTYSQPEVHEMLAGDLRMYFDAYRGEIREARILESGEQVEAKIILEGDYDTWKMIATGRLGLKKAVLMTRQLKVRGAKITELVKYMKLAERIMEILAETRHTYVFPDEQRESA